MVPSLSANRLQSSSSESLSKPTSSGTALCNRMRFSASMIRTEGRFFNCWDRRKLFNGWVLGPLYASALAFLPLLNITQRQKIQVAMNSGIRAILQIFLTMANTTFLLYAVNLESLLWIRSQRFWSKQQHGNSAIVSTCKPWKCPDPQHDQEHKVMSPSQINRDTWDKWFRQPWLADGIGSQRFSRARTTLPRQKNLSASSSSIKMYF